MKNKLFFFGIVVSFMLSVISCAGNKENPASAPQEASTQWNSRANEAQKELWRVYWNNSNFRFNSNENGETNLNYWWQAHALDVLVDFGSRTDSIDTITKISSLHNGVSQANSGFINEYYDDMEWMGLANLRAYNFTKNQKYLNTSVLLWNDITTGWNTRWVSGGICWKKSQTDYKNTPANAPAAILAARLYNYTKDTAYLNWSLKIYDWLNSNLVDPVTGIVWDGINRNKDGAIDKTWLFTYNQGVYIGASIELFKITKAPKYLASANKTMDAVISKLLVSGTNILKSEGGGDGGLFKGILIRYITELVFVPELESNLRAKYIKFLTDNANSLWNKAKRPAQLIFNSDWTASPSGNNMDLSVQLSAVMLLESMARLEKDNLTL